MGVSKKNTTQSFLRRAIARPISPTELLTSALPGAVDSPDSRYVAVRVYGPRRDLLKSGCGA